MKNIKSNKKAIKELAGHFDKELQAHLPVTLLPNGILTYKDYYIKQLDSKNWGLFRLYNKELVDQYFLKTCALMAAKAYSTTNLDRVFKIKRLDNRYWANYSDSVVFKNNLKLVKDFDRYQVLLTRYNHSEQQAKNYKQEISKMFRWSFV